MRRKTLSDAGVKSLKPKDKRYAYPDPELRGHLVRVQPSGAKSFVAVARSPAGKQIWVTVGTPDMMGIETAREGARDAIRRKRAGLPAVELNASGASFRAVVETYLQRHVRAKGLLSEYEIVRCLNVYVMPSWGGREFASIRRGDVAALLDRVEVDNGGRQADYVLAIIRNLCNWYQARNEGYTSPIVKGMRRASPGSAKRDRILSDDELRALWTAAESNGQFGAFLRLALVTAQRREKLAKMRWDDIEDGVWNVPSEARQKGTGGALPLPAVALDILDGLPRFEGNPYVFAGRGDGPFNGYSKAKKAFDKKCAIAPWVIHDLRRTARSLMARAGVRPDIAERVLGHVIAGVEGVYDRHTYRDEKGQALARLAELIQSITKK